MNDNVITVLLPVHNGCQYIAESIASVLAQREVNFELSVLDDDSSDATYDIVKAFDDRRVRYSRNPNRMGLFATLNRGFHEARTDWVRIWAHDDRMIDGSLEKFVIFGSRHPAVGMIYCDYVPIDASGRRTPPNPAYIEQRMRTPDVCGPNVSALLFLYYGCLPGNISTVMLRRSVWEAVGGFRAGLQQSPDYEMWINASALAPVGFIPEPLVELRAHAQQLSIAGQANMNTIEEELPVIAGLRTRLSGIVTEREFQRHWTTHRGRQHIHWIVRALLRGDLPGARKGWRAVRSYERPWRQVIIWFCTANGRWGVPSIAAAVDRKLSACAALDAAGSE